LDKETEKLFRSPIGVAMSFVHFSVLKDECLTFLTENASPNSYFADLTFGGGGHSFALVEKDQSYKLIGVDQDPDALNNGAKLIAEKKMGDRIDLISSNFSKFPDLMKEKYPEVKFQGILMDLGVSSHQFDIPERGFSFKHEAPLDMRMNYDDDSIETAADICNTRDVDELEEIFKTYGEERFSKRIAEKIVEERPIATTKDLEDIIFHCYPKKMRFGKTHPATRCFQALRIAVNEELGVLSEVLPQLVGLLKSGGRLAVISFHSLEDRIVKRAFKELGSKDGPFRILTKKPLTPSEREIATNSRSRSAKLRVIERI